MRRSLTRSRFTSFAVVLLALAPPVVAPGSLLAQTNTPPVVQITSLTSSETAQSRSFNLNYCDDHGLNGGSEQVLLNGTNVTSNFPYQTGTGGSPYCMYNGRASGSVNAQIGMNTFSVTMCESLYAGGPATPLCTTTTQQFRFRDIDVVPTVSSVKKAPNHTGQSVDFQLNKMAPFGASWFRLTLTCSGNVTCVAGSVPDSIYLLNYASATVHPVFNTGAQGTTGSVTLRATAIGTPEDYHQASVGVTNDWPGWLTVSGTPNNNDDQSMGTCAFNCFAAVGTVSSAPYYSMDQERGVKLVYHGDRVAVRPFVYADVSLPAGADPVRKLTLEVRNASNQRIPFLNGDDILFFGPGAANTDTLRLGGQIDGMSLSGAGPSPGMTGMYSVSIVVNAYFDNNHVETQTIATKLLIVNERNSPIASGWTVAGVQRLYEQTLTDSSVLITEGDGSALYFARSGSSYVTPPGDFTVLTVSGVGSSRQWIRASPDSTKAYFNSNGLLMRVVDRFGNSVDFDYDGQNRLTKVYDPFRKIGTARVYTKLTYDANNYGLDSIAEFFANGFPYGGRLTNVNVDASHRLTSVQDAGGTASYGYDGLGRLITVTDPRGATSTLVYRSDNSWKLARAQSPLVPVDIGGGVTRDSVLATAFDAWQTVGVPTAHTDTLTLVTPPTVSALVATVTDPAGHVTRMAPDRWGQPIKVTDAVGNVTTTRRNANGQATDIQGPTGAWSWYAYSGPFLIASRPAGEAEKDYSYGAWGQLKSESGQGPGITYYTNDAANGRLDSTKVAGQFKTTYTYDAYGRVLTIVDPQSHTTTYTYDPVWGNQDSVRTPTGLGSKTRFDRFGRDSVFASSGRGTVTTIYDDVNRVISENDGVNPNPARFTYDGDQASRVVDPKGQLFKTSYDSLGRAIRIYDSADTTKYVSITYTGDGLVASTTNRMKRRVDFAYDGIHRIIAQVDPLADSVSLAYDGPGLRMVGKSFDRGRNLIAMDSAFTSSSGWTDSTVTWLNNNTQRFRRVYRMGWMSRLDSLGISSTSNIDFYKRRWYYNSATGGVDSLDVGSRRVKYTYTTEGLRSTTNLSGITRTETWTAEHRANVTSFDVAATNDAFKHAYGYDAQGRLSSDTRYPNGGSSVLHNSYSFDLLDRLQRVYRDSVATVNQCVNTNTPPYYTCSNVQKTFVLRKAGLTYDAASNLQQQTDSLYGTVTGAIPDPGNRQRSLGSVTFAYDSDGNVISRSSAAGTTNFGWDGNGQLRWAANGADTTFFDYDASSRLVRRRKSNGVVDRWYLWDHDRLLAELNSTATDRVAEYVYNADGGTDEPLAVITGATTVSSLYWYAQNALGNIDGTIDPSGGGAVQQLRYDEWGGLESFTRSSGDTTHLRWKGMYFEGAPAALYYMQARWYDPQARRFISEDPIGISSGLNQFLFSGNDPIGGRDPQGTCATERQMFGDWIPWFPAMPGEQMNDRYGMSWVCGCDGISWMPTRTTCDLGMMAHDAFIPNWQGQYNAMHSYWAPPIRVNYCPVGSDRPSEGPITSPFGAIRNVGTSPHVGVDIAGGVGTPIRALGDGTVTDAHFGPTTGGNMVSISYGNGVTTTYFHMRDPAIVKPGDHVHSWTVVGYQGYTGHVSPPGPRGAHLHVTLEENGVKKDAAICF